jgi:hypothetical protein
MPYGPAGRRLVWALLALVVLELVYLGILTAVAVR